MAAVALLALLATGTARAAVPADSVTITGGPSGETTETAATFTFEGTGAVTHFRCLIDTQRTAVPCSTPVSYTGLSVGARTFTVFGYRGDVPVGVSATRSWTIVVPPPSPPMVTAALTAPPAANPGAVVLLDASASAGPVEALQYDIDGNGAYETACPPGTPAGVVFGTPGSYTVGVLAIGGGGVGSTAQAKVSVGGPATPPAGKKVQAAVAVGGCAGGVLVETATKLYTCPSTVVTGVAEAAFPADAPTSSCFTREIVGEGLVIERFVAPASAVALVNGLRIRPSSGSRVVILTTIPQVGVTPGLARVEIAHKKPSVDVDTGYGPLSWDVTKPGIAGKLQVGGFDDRFLGLVLPQMEAPLTLTKDRRAKVDLRLKLPKPFERAASGKFTLTTDNTAGPVISAFSISVAKIPIAGVALENVKLSYHADGSVDVWTGTFGLRLPPAPTAQGASSLFEVRNGAVTRAELEVTSNPPWGPIACCFFLTRLKGTYTGPDEVLSQQYAIGAEADITAGPTILGWSLLKLKAAGRLHWHPDGGAAIEVNGKLLLLESEDFSLANGHFFAKMGSGNTWIWFEGSVDWDLIVITAKGGVHGTIGDPGAGLPGPDPKDPWKISGGVDLCVKFVSLCAGGKVAASDIGVAGCLYVELVYSGIAAGGVYYWDGDWDTFWGCSKGKLRKALGQQGFALAGGEGTFSLPHGAQTTFDVPAGLRSYLVKVSGVGGAPLVALVGPGGRRIVTPGPDEPKTDRRTWLAVAVPRDSATYFDISRPAGGTWRVDTLPGSVPVAGLEVAGPLPERLVIATVVGSGERRRLRFRADHQPGQRIVFTEVGRGVQRAIATTSAARGELPFAPSDGARGVRTIEATTIRERIPIRTETVARFRVSAARFAAPRISLARRGPTLSVRWAPVEGASAYRVTSTLSDGRIVTRDVVRTAITVAGVAPLTGGRVTVQGRSGGGRYGRIGSATLRPAPTVDVVTTTTAQILARRQIVVRCALPADGACRATANIAGRRIGSGAARGRYGAIVTVRVPISSAGVRILGARHGALRLTVDVPGEGPRLVPVR